MTEESTITVDAEWTTCPCCAGAGGRVDHHASSWVEDSWGDCPECDGDGECFVWFEVEVA